MVSDVEYVNDKIRELVGKLLDVDSEWVGIGYPERDSGVVDSGEPDYKFLFPFDGVFDREATERKLVAAFQKWLVENGHDVPDWVINPDDIVGN